MDILGRVEKIESDLDDLISKAELWQLIFDQSPFAMACFDQNMNFSVVNREFCNLTGYSTMQLIGKNIGIVIPSGYRKLHILEEKKFISHPQRKVNRHGLNPYLLKKNGGKIHVHIDLSYLNYKSSIYPIAFIRKV
jgi:PAS domain S-box-containing protein